MSISLIANSGLQFHRFEIEIDPNDDIFETMGFFEEEDESNTIQLEYAYYLPNSDIWVSKKVLKEEGYLDDDENPIADINHNVVRGFALTEDQNYYTKSDIKDCMDIFASKEDENIWLPAPYFKRNNNGKSIFGPLAWSRMLIKRKSKETDIKQKYQIILAFDTDIEEDNEKYFTPNSLDTTNQDNFFALSNNEDHNLHFCDENFDCGWVDDYLKRIYIKRKNEEDPEIQITEIKKFPYTEYLGFYLYLVKHLEATKTFPEIILYSDKQPAIDIDLVIDIGNSNTCGLLFESPTKGNSFEFKSVKKLNLTDLSDPEKEYNDPFSMRLAFVEAKFGEIKIPGFKNFRWPSLLRLGKEAAKFINELAVIKYNVG